MLEKIKSYYWTPFSFEKALEEIKFYSKHSLVKVWFFPFLVEEWESEYIGILEQLVAMERGYLNGRNQTR